jgi:type VI secretion system protein ImpF
MARSTTQIGTRNPRSQLQIPIMYAFREAHEAKDAKISSTTYQDGERVLSERAAMRRRGANEAQLKRNLYIDLVHLSNTINLDAIEDLSEFKYVARSVLNYGVVDLSNLTSEDADVSKLCQQLADALVACEPRFVPESMSVKIRDKFDDVNQKLMFDISAEMACKPMDIPLEFAAEIDVGSGKMQLNDTSGRS